LPKEHDVIQRVQQKHLWGCELACVAMVRGVSYDEVFAACSPSQRAALERGESRGPFRDGDWGVAHDLRAHGIRFAIRWPEKPVALDPIWRPEPRTAVSIYATSRSAEVNEIDGLHAVVVLRDGTVLDPEFDPPPRLADLFVWHVVEILDERG
jgi:hypothetical protein